MEQKNLPEFKIKTEVFNNILNSASSFISIFASISFVFTFVLIYLYSNYYGIEVGLVLNFNFFFAKFFESSILVILFFVIFEIIKNKMDKYKKLGMLLCINFFIYLFSTGIKLFNFLFFSFVEIFWYLIFRKTKTIKKIDNFFNKNEFNIILCIIGFISCLLILYIIVGNFIISNQKTIRVLENSNQAIIYSDNNYSITLDCYEENNILYLIKYSQNIHNTINIKSAHKIYNSIKIENQKTNQMINDLKFITNILKYLIYVV